MSLLHAFFEKYDRLVLFDTETTGLIFNRDEIIEFAAVVLEMRNGQVEVVEEYLHPAFSLVAFRVICSRRCATSRSWQPICRV